VVAALAVIVGAPGGIASAAVGGLTVVSTPVLTRPAVLNAVALAAPADGWAVGSVGLSPLAGSGVDTLIEHWNGTGWTVAPTPAVSSSDEALTGVAAFSPTDAWAVGWQLRYGGYSQAAPILMHWNGSGWARKAPPSTAVPTAIAGSGPDDIWAVGGGAFEHFDGAVWRSVPAAVPVGSVTGISVISPSDAWAVGSINAQPGGYSDLAHPYVVHWDGSAWTRVGVPHPATDARLSAVSASSPTDVWAVGSALDPATQTTAGFAVHFDGTRWARVAVPSLGGLNGLSGVTTAGPANAWTVGSREGFTSNGNAVLRTLAEHWDGHQWRIVTSPNDSSQDNYLTAVTLDRTGQVWTVGGDGGTLVQTHVP